MSNPEATVKHRFSNPHLNEIHFGESENESNRLKNFLKAARKRGQTALRAAWRITPGASADRPGGSEKCSGAGEQTDKGPGHSPLVTDTNPVDIVVSDNFEEKTKRNPGSSLERSGFDRD